jgi:hypothetical protein
MTIGRIVQVSISSTTAQHIHLDVLTPVRCWLALTMAEQKWAPQGDEDYYAGVTFERNDVSQGPYGGYNHAGTPVAFEIRRVSK